LAQAILAGTAVAQPCLGGQAAVTNQAFILDRVSRMSVLVVDDDDVDRERVLRFLKGSLLHFDATEANSGAEALRAVKGKSFDCIVLDNQLGDVIGSDILPTLQHESLQICPVIMVTGEGDEDVAVRALRGGAADYLPKRHLSAELLIHSICNCMDQQRLRDELAEAHRLLQNSVRAQARIINQRERDLKSILDHMPALISSWDASLHNRFGNRAYREWFGVSPEHMTAMRARDVIGAAGGQVVAPHIDSALGGAEQFFEYVTPAQPGQPARSCQANFIPDREADGSVAGFYSLVIDVTPLKEAQTRADELAAFNEAVIQSSPIGIGVYTADGRCLLTNAALLDSIGGEAGLGSRQKNLRTLAWAETSGLLREADATLADGRPRACEVYAADAADRTLWLECRLAAIDHQGERCLLLISQDVTVQRLAKTELAAARDGANAAAQSKGNFLANMSHEIRTPMNAIVGLSRLALEEDLPARSRDFIDKVHGSALALMGILDDVLDYSKIEAGELRFESVDFDLDELLQRMVDLFAAQFERKGLEFIIEVLPGVPSRLTGDPLRLSQVLCNLVGNAIKFTEQGEIVVGVSAIDPSAGPGCHLRFAVQDTGVGIDPASQSALFEPFMQADTSITRRFGGSGLGLAICKRLVRQMEGQVAVKSVPGVGSEFSFDVRLGVASALAPAPAHAELASQHVLVVDDNLVCRRSLATQLEALGVHAITASGGKAAIRRVARAQQAGYPFDAILLDAAMPGLDGLQTLQGLRRQEARRGWPASAVVMMVPTFGRAAFPLATQGEHPDHFLAKPVLRTQLLDTLLRVRGGTQSRAPTTGSDSLALLKTRAVALAGARLLLVEDNPVNQLVAAEMLKVFGIDVTVAADGVDAVEAVRDAGPGHFHVVLMDLHMPRMDGFEATRRIHALPHAEQLPVIAMSAAVLPADRALAFAAGMVDHVAKPILMEQLVNVLLKWVRA
jgi:signal transduction histidine kinase/DNA-binding response OmpR family regulator